MCAPCAKIRSTKVCFMQERKPAFSFRSMTARIGDLVVKDDDLVVATHGRSFWVLDDLTPIRQVNAQSAQADTILYQPQTALRLHYPTEVDKRQPVGDNPPPGAIIDYYLKS